MREPVVNFLPTVGGLLARAAEGRATEQNFMGGRGGGENDMGLGTNKGAGDQQVGCRGCLKGGSMMRWCSRMLCDPSASSREQQYMQKMNLPGSGPHAPIPKRGSPTPPRQVCQVNGTGPHTLHIHTINFLVDYWGGNLGGHLGVRMGVHCGVHSGDRSVVHVGVCCAQCADTGERALGRPPSGFPPAFAWVFTWAFSLALT